MSNYVMKARQCGKAYDQQQINQDMLSCLVKMVHPEPLILHKGMYNQLEGMGLDMTGCVKYGLEDKE